MKQSITKEQWNKLNVDEQKYFIDNCKTVLGVPIWESITIGRMIEYLGDDWERLVREHGGRVDNEVLYLKNLCDALWNTVVYEIRNS